MRLLLAFGLVLLSTLPSAAAAPDGAPPSPRSVLWRPHAWRPPARLTPAGAAGMRIEPETGVSSTRMEDLAALIAARRHALAQVPVRMRPDGSRYAVVGGLARAYTVVHVNADGTRSQECIETEAQAKALSGAPPATPAVKKER